jgi:O-antigen ligase
MTETDITNVERGYASVNMTRGALYARLSSVKHQLEHPENPNGHSLLQRLEYWKAGTHIIGEDPVAGVGYGDVQRAFDAYYTTSRSPLEKDLRLRAHNQYLTSWITAGIAGLLSFLFWWTGFFRYAWKNKQYPAVCFAVIAMSSFLMEDTMETQAGVTFVAFFYGLFAGRAGQSIELIVRDRTFCKY